MKNLAFELSFEEILDLTHRGQAWKPQGVRSVTKGMSRLYLECLVQTQLSWACEDIYTG